MVTAPITGLAPATEYHYRLVATDPLTGDESVGVDRVFTTRATPGPPVICPNESSRVGPSAGPPGLPRLRIRHPGAEQLGPSRLAVLLPYGRPPRRQRDRLDTLRRARRRRRRHRNRPTPCALREPSGWSTKSLSAATPEATGTAYTLNPSSVGLSTDLRQSLLWINMPLVGAASPAGTNLYLRRADGSIVPLTRIGAPLYGYGGELLAASQDFTRLFIVSTVRQFDTDPDVALNPYEWFNGQLRLVTILPNGEAAPGGGSLPTNRAAQPIASDDGRSVLFNAAGYSDLFLRIDGERTIDVSTSQKSGSPGPAQSVGSAGMAADGSKVIFTSTSELTDDAYTGRTSGAPNNKGSDLYSYDVETGDLTDLTVDHEPADKETGAGVEHVVGASRDASYIYFIASGKLAPGGTSGSRNVYVEHDGEIKFVATNPVGTFETGFPFYVTPNGLYAGFMTNEPQTGYDNAGHTEVYKYTYNGALECASCRPDGEPPDGDAAIVGRVVSEDGSKVFFQSNDAIVPRASSGLMNVFEYEGSEVHLLSPGGGGQALLVGASLSGDDVFVATFDELARGEGPVFAVYDARVGANVPPQAETAGCQGENCRGPGSPRSTSRPPARPPSRRPGRSRSSAPRPSGARRRSSASWCRAPEI